MAQKHIPEPHTAAQTSQSRQGGLKCAQTNEGVSLGSCVVTEHTEVMVGIKHRIRLARNCFRKYTKELCDGPRV